MKTFCPEDGFNVKVDEDGCCVHCGSTAVGPAVNQLEEDARGRKFVRHIAGHLEKGQFVICKICHRSIDQICDDETTGSGVESHRPAPPKEPKNSDTVDENIYNMV